MEQIISVYKSNIGIIELKLFTDYTDFNIREQSKGNMTEIIIESQPATIYIIEFPLPNQIHNGQKIKKSIGWSILIKSNVHNVKNLSFKCSFQYQIKGNIETGENLDAIKFVRGNDVLHIGTEDVESFKQRAKFSYFMPNRFSNLLEKLNHNGNHFTQYLKNGFTTAFPTLLKDEIIKFHFLIAESKYTDNEDISTWISVDKTIEEVECIIKKNE